MPVAKIADIVRQQASERNPMVKLLGFAVDGSDDAVASRLVEAVRQNDDATAAAGDLFPDLTEMSDSGGTSSFDDDGFEDAWVARRRGQ